ARESAARCRYAATGSPGSGPRASLITPGLRGSSVRSAVRITTSARTITTPTPSVVTAPRRTVRSLTGGLTSRRPQGVQRVLQVLRSEEHTSELQSRFDLVCRLLLEQKNTSLMT